ncbi:YciI family protein [Roseibium sp.]|uniref:YciI family protein n=1 Tax=Roseibium sp. TaxID=1936156 RepID=UPI003A981D30
MDTRLFIIDLQYKVPLSLIELHAPAHMAFLEEHYAAGRFLASGPKVPRDGGVILARSVERAELENLIVDDPFHQHDLADYRITEFVARRTGPGLDLS